MGKRADQTEHNKKLAKKTMDANRRGMNEQERKLADYERDRKRKWRLQ